MFQLTHVTIINETTHSKRKEITLNLNQQQQEAVEHYGSPLVIIAGAGTGKTSVIISKIQHLINLTTITQAIFLP